MSYINANHITVGWGDFSYEKGKKGKEKETHPIAIFYSQSEDNSALKKEESIFYQKTAWDIFVCAMAIGIKMNKRKKIESKSSTIPISAIHGRIIPILGAILGMEDVDLEILNDPTQIRTICEEYANGGIELLMDWMNNHDPDDPLSELKKRLESII